MGTRWLEHFLDRFIRYLSFIAFLSNLGDGPRSTECVVLGALAIEISDALLLLVKSNLLQLFVYYRIPKA